MKPHHTLALILTVVFFSAAAWSIHSYGINWDSPGHMLQGQAYAHYFLTRESAYPKTPMHAPIFVRENGKGASRYYFSTWESAAAPGTPQEILTKSEFETFLKQYSKPISFYESNAWSPKQFMDTKETGHPPHIDILAAFSNKLFYQTLGVVGDIESYQLVYILFCALGIFFVTLFTWDLTHSYVGSVVAGLGLALYPLYFAEAHFNMKDPIAAAFFAGSMWTAWKWVKTNKNIWGLACVISVLLGVGVKWNVIFLPIILIPWLFFIRHTAQFQKWWNLKKNAVFAGVFILGFIFLFTLLWPSHQGFFGRLVGATTMYWQFGTGGGRLQPDGFIGPFGINVYPAALVFSQTPEVLLILAGFGITKKTIPVLLWLLIPIIRISAPGMSFYGGLRQIMEVVPALAVLSGIGAVRLLHILNKAKILGFLYIMMSFISLLFILIRLHPNENVYFNAFVGGLPGAVKKNLTDWTLTYGNVYKQAVAWINDHAEENAKLTYLDASMLAISPLWLRGDIRFSPEYFSGFDQKGEYIMQLTNSLNPPVFAARYPGQFLEPIYQVKVDGVPLLSIYKNNQTNVGTHMIDNVPVKEVKTMQGDYFVIDIGKRVRVTKIITSQALTECLSDNFEFIGFYQNDFDNLDVANLFFLNERRSLGEGIVEYSFAAEPARVIKIFPRSDESCFAQGKDAHVYFRN